MRPLFILLAITGITAAFGTLFIVYPGILQSILNELSPAHKCGPGDAGCLADVMKENRDNCIPSVTEVTNKDGIVLRVTITREGSRCIRYEEVVGVNESYRYLLGYNVTCDTPLDQLDDPKALLGCSGSVQDYLAPPESPASGGESSGPAGPPYLYCGLEDEDCKSTAEDYLGACTTSEIVNIDPVWRPLGYWTLYFSIQKQDKCRIYIEVLNAVNIPPGYPSDIIGYNLSCTIPLEDLPLNEMTEEYCAGNLLPYF